jgi:serine/threonine protein kinase
MAAPAQEIKPIQAGPSKVPANIPKTREIPAGYIDGFNPKYMTKIFVEFEGAREILHVYESSGEIVDELLAPIPNSTGGRLCSFMAKIEKTKPLGGGVFGKVYSVTFPGMGKYSRPFAVKAPKKKPRDATYLGMDKRCKISDPNQNNYTLYNGRRVTITNNTYKALNGRNYPINVHQSYLCDKETYSEYIISILTGQLYRNGMVKTKSGDPYCVNFLNVFEFTTCYKPKEQQYIFMEQADATLNKLTTNNWSIEAQLFVFVQILLSIYIYQSFNISHNDLKNDNIFMEKITQNTIYNSQRMLDNTHIEYKLPGGTFYLSIPSDNAYIVKIGDWGQSIKYGMETKPTVGFFDVFQGIFDGNQTANTPNWFAPAYDLFTFFNISSLYFEQFSVASHDWLVWMTGNERPPFDKSSRPQNRYVDDYKNISELLEQREFDSLKTPPGRGSKVLTVADITSRKRGVVTQRRPRSPQDFLLTSPL